MALLFVREEQSYSLAVWKMEESLDELSALLPGSQLPQEALHRFKVPHRRLEWLTARVLLRQLLYAEPLVDYLASGKPCLKNDTRQISISHTKGYVAVIVGTMQVGVDIERYAERVHKVAHKFIRTDEEAADTWMRLLHWSAKETMFKCMDATEVDFREHLQIFPFRLQEEGSFLSQEYRTPLQRTFRIHYLCHPHFVLTWFCG